MIAIKYEDCDGCGACVESCPTGALLLQNGKACFDQDICEGYEVCIDSCPQEAIIRQEEVPAGTTVIQIPLESTPVPSNSGEVRDLTIRDVVLPAIGSFLVWTGREIAPRLANLVLKTLDRRVQPADPTSKYETMQYANRGAEVRGRHRRLRRRRHDNN